MLLSIWQDSWETLCRFLELFFLTMILSSPVLTAIQEYWSGEPFPSPEDLSNPGIKPRPPTLQEDFLLSKPTGKPNSNVRIPKFQSFLFRSMTPPLPTYVPSAYTIAWKVPPETRQSPHLFSVTDHSPILPSLQCFIPLSGCLDGNTGLVPFYPGWWKKRCILLWLSSQ